MKQARCVVYRSDNGRDHWEPVGPESVPEFVKQPTVMGRPLAGEECMDTREGRSGSAWYRAVRVGNQQERDMVEGALSTLH